MVTKEHTNMIELYTISPKNINEITRAKYA